MLMFDLINTLPRHPMATRASALPIGFGPAHQLYSVQQQLPIFSGDKSTFHTFSFACSAAFLDVNCENVLVPVVEWRKAIDAAPMATRKGSNSADTSADALMDGKVADKDTLVARSRFVSKVLLARLSPEVAKNVRAILTDDELQCGNKVWNILCTFYSMPAAETQRKVERNPETLLYSALTARPRKDELTSAFVQRLRIEAAKMFRSPRLSNSESARKFVTGALARTVLETALKEHKDLESVRTELRKLLIDDSNMVSLDTLDDLQRRI